jgi:hypothetical protein
VLSLRSSDELYLGACQVWSRGEHIEMLELHAPESSVRDVGLVQEYVIGGSLKAGAIDANATRRVSLWVTVDEESSAFGNRQAGGQVDRGGGLANPALLVCDRDDAGHGCLSFGVSGEGARLGRPFARKELPVLLQPVLELLSFPALRQMIPEERKGGSQLGATKQPGEIVPALVPIGSVYLSSESVRKLT